MKEIVVFILHEQRYALHLSVVERVVRAVEVTPLPKAPEVAAGVINVQGRIIPVLNVRKRFLLPEREIEVSDHFIIANTLTRTVALVVDKVSGVAKCSEEQLTAAEKILPGMEYVEGVLKLEDDVVLIHDLGTFLSLEEEEAIEDVISKI